MLNNLTLRQLRAFRAVASAESFTAAAEQLHLTPAAISGLIKELESQVGVRLLDRNTRSVSLSYVGREFFPLAERVLQDLDMAVSSLTVLKERRRGIVRIAAPEVLSCTLVPRAMAEFNALYPHIKLHFFDVPVEEVITRTRHGEVDLGITPESMLHSELEGVELIRAKLMLAVRRDDPLAEKSSVSWSSIRERKFVTFHRRFSDLSPFSQVKSDKQFLPNNVTVVQRVNTAFAMVQAGFGVSACPLFAKELATGFGLVLVKLTHPQIERTYDIVKRAGYSQAPAVEAFHDFLIEFAPRWARTSAKH